VTCSRTWPPAPTSPRPRTWSCSAHPGSASILAVGLGIKAAQNGYSVLFDTASQWISRLAVAHNAGQLETELKKIRRYKLIIIDEVGYIPFDTDAANLFFQLVASRYEQGSIVVTSNLPFAGARPSATTSWPPP
jgi:DNA replication protein DnaC